MENTERKRALSRASNEFMVSASTYYLADSDFKRADNRIKWKGIVFVWTKCLDKT